MRPEPGMLVTPNVKLERELREGGMGSVWVATHLTLDTTVAVKFVLAELARGGEQVLERFKREAKAAARLKSPHVVKTLDHGVTADGVAYIVMEMLEGETLSERLQKRGRLPLAEVEAVVTQVAKALGEAHELGIVHRDIKPSNVFLTQAHGELFVKILDFGIAKAMLEPSDVQVTSTGAMVGTLHYMSPEQMNDSRTVGKSADLWSLAVVAYHALTGRLPFDEATPVAMWKTIVAESYAPASKRLGVDDPELDGWFQRAFHADPEDRFPSARAMADAFRQLAQDGARSSATATAPEAAESATPDMGTAEFLAKIETDPGAKPHGRTSGSPSPPPSDERTSAAVVAETTDRREAVGMPLSRLRRRRSMVQGILLGAAVAVALAAGAWLAFPRATPLPRPPATTATTITATPIAPPTAEPSPTASAPQLLASASAPPVDPGPLNKAWPLGCLADKRPCGLGCCMWDRGCEPGGCDDPLAEADELDARLAVAAVWPQGHESDRKVLYKADVYVRFGAGGARKPLFWDQPLRVTGADLRQLVSAWVQPNLPGLPGIVEFQPRGIVGGPTHLILCRGFNVKVEQGSNTYWIWMSVLRAGEKPPELCNKVR